MKHPRHPLALLLILAVGIHQGAASVRAQTTLRRGNAGPQVKELQQQLNRAIDAKLQLDGRFGPATEKAVRRFQQIVGLKPTGIADSETFAQLRQAAALPKLPHDPLRKALVAQLILHEDKRFWAYNDNLCIPTIGVGFNLMRPDARRKLAALGVDYQQVLQRSRGLTNREIYHLFLADLDAAIAHTRRLFPQFDQLDLVRQRVLVDMCFNLGPAKLAGFKKMIAAVKRRDFQSAAAEMKNSRWYRQVGRRGVRLVQMMQTGKLPAELR